MLCYNLSDASSDLFYDAASKQTTDQSVQCLLRDNYVDAYTQWSPRATVTHIDDIPLTQSSEEEAFIPNPETHIYGNLIRKDDQDFFEGSSSGVLHLVKKIEKHFSAVRPSCKNWSEKRSISLVTSSTKTLFSEIQRNINKPIYPLEVIVNGPRGISFIIERSDRAAGTIRNKFTTLIQILKVLKSDWLPNNKIKAVNENVVKISCDAVDEAILYYKCRRSYYQKFDKIKQFENKEKFDQSFVFPSNPIEIVMQSDQFDYLKTNVSTMDIEHVRQNFEKIRNNLVVVMFALSPIRPGPFWSMTLHDANTIIEDTYGNGEVIVRASDKVSKSHGPPSICITPEILPAFHRYKDAIVNSMEKSDRPATDIHFFPKDLLFNAYHVSSLTRIIDAGLTSIFGQKMTNNRYRHALATDMLKKGVDHTLTEKFLRTSSNMLKTVYEQFYGSNRRMTMHAAVLKACLPDPVPAVEDAVNCRQALEIIELD